MSFICLNLFMQGIIIKTFCTVCFLGRNFVITLAQTFPRNTGLWKRVDTHGSQWQIDETPASGLLIGIRGIPSLKIHHLSHVSVLYLLLFFFFWGAPLGILWDSYLFRGCPSIDSKKEDNKSRSEWDILFKFMQLIHKVQEK